MTAAMVSTPMPMPVNVLRQNRPQVPRDMPIPSGTMSGSRTNRKSAVPISTAIRCDVTETLALGVRPNQR